MWIALSSLLAACGSGSMGGATSDNSTMAVSNETELVASGAAGGPFSAGSIVYQIENLGTEPLAWEISVDQAWIDVSPLSGSLPAAQTQDVTVTLNGGTRSLPAGYHAGTIAFTKAVHSVPLATRHSVVSATRRVYLNIGSMSGTPMLAASRTSGPAPLSVFFDAVGAATGIVQPAGATPDHNSFTHVWDYGDPLSGDWTDTGRSRNRSVGYLGAHVYDSPGTYRASLRVTDAAGTTFEYYQDITVTDPAVVYANGTFYVAATGSDSNPGTITQPFRTFDRGMNQLFAANGPRRLLLRRGDTIASSQRHHLTNHTGPYLIGAYGTGARPHVVGNPASYGIDGTQVSSLAVADIDFALSGPRTSVSGALVAGPSGLMLRCGTDGQGVAFMTYSSDCVVADCTFLNHSYASVWPDTNTDAEAIRFAMLGTRLDGCAGHLIRNSFSKCLLAENHFGHTAVTAIKLNGRELPDPLHHQCVIGNVFATNTGGWVFEMGPQNDTVAEYLTDVLIEGNTFRPITEPSFVVVVFSVRTALRNNIFDIGASTACHFARRGIGPTPVGCSFDHNTVVRRNGSPMWTLNAQTGDITPVRNNIWHCTQGQVLPPSGTINEIGSFTGNPMFTNPANLDFSLQLGSPAIDAAVGTHVRVDFNRAPRSPGSLDVGALERQ